MDNQERIRRFLCGFFRTDELRNQDDIFALGFVNSLFGMQLVLYIEQEFNLTVEDEDLEIENFNTIDHIDEFISRKRLGAARALAVEPATRLEGP
jgi:acyl carrier protein